MTLPSLQICQRIRHLFAMVGSPNENEANVARERLNKLLADQGLTWNDLPEILALPDISTDTRAGAAQGPMDAPVINVLDLVLRLIEDRIAITEEERMAVALWVLHTYVFDQFSVTPRLALLSPVPGCGKTTLLILLELLTANPYRTDNVSAAAIYHFLARSRYTFLIDEVDNLDLFRNSVLRTVFNSGHRRGGNIGRFVDGQPCRFELCAPLAVAAIGEVPLPLLQRSVVINMRRQPPGESQLQRLDEIDPCFVAAREQIKKWATTCSLARDPEIPSSLRNRAVDNWRVLLSIADDLGHGEEARSAAIKLLANLPDEDPGVLALTSSRTVFLGRGIDRIASLALVEALWDLDDGFWSEWRGLHGNQPPHKLTQGELGQLLRRFQIRPHTIWPLHRRSGDRSSRGYMRHQFEAAWRAYCPSDTPTHPQKVRCLRQS